MEDRYNTTVGVALKHEISLTTVVKFVKNDKLYPNKVHLVLELNEDNLNKGPECYKIMMNKCHNNIRHTKRFYFQIRLLLSFMVV